MMLWGGARALSPDCLCSIYFNPRGGRPGILSPQGVDINHEEFPAGELQPTRQKQQSNAADCRPEHISRGAVQASLMREETLLHKERPSSRHRSSAHADSWGNMQNGLRA